MQRRNNILAQIWFPETDDGNNGILLTTKSQPYIVEGGGGYLDRYRDISSK